MLGLLFLLGAQAADTLVVRLPAEADAGEPVAPVEELRIGSIDGLPETTFGTVSGVVVDTSGATWVADGQATELRRFAEDGRYLGTVGRKGGGPGEFEQIQGLALLPDGDVAVWDPGSFRVSRFSPEGAFRGSFQVEMRGIVGGSDPGFLADTAGRVLIRTLAEIPEPGPGPREAAYAWLRHAPDGAFVDSVIPPRRNIGGVYAAFLIETASRPSPHGYLVTGRNDAYALTRPLSDGRAVRFERAVARVPLTDGERAQWAARVEEWDRRWGWDSPPLPSTKPAWKSLFVDADGRIWVARYAPATLREGYPDATAERGGWPPVEWRQDERYDVIDPRGALVGTLDLPAGSQVVWARGARLWTLERGAFDETYVVRYRMEPGSTGGP